MDKIEKILETSIKVIKDCCLKNGAIVAANIHDPDYPEGVKNYYYVWLRDASFVCVVCDLIGLRKIPEKFFKWCWGAEKFKDKGIFFMRYHPNGKMYGSQFQPDQTGSLLWSIEHHSKYRNVNRFNDLIERAADGICNSWKGKCFKKSYDIWEEDVALSKRNEKHTYSLAICIKGLKSASNLIGPKERWSECVKQMQLEMEKSYNRKLGYFVRTFDGKNKTLDSSMLGLVWPSEFVKANDRRIVSTVNKIIKDNTIENGGVVRYKGDRYVGSLRRGEGGAWPVLNFWLSIYFAKLGDLKNAKKYFNWVIERVENKLPEQIKGGKPASIIPLAWSHAMFVIAGKFLKLF